MNDMVLIANPKGNFDACGACGNAGWDSKAISPYYKKALALTLPSEEKRKQLGLEYVDEKFNGSNGPIQASFPDALVDLIANVWIESLKGPGYPSSLGLMATEYTASECVSNVVGLSTPCLFE